MREQGGDNIKVVKDNVKNYEDLPTVPTQTVRQLLTASHAIS